jgi:hypothetical protein
MPVTSLRPGEGADTYACVRAGVYGQMLLEEVDENAEGAWSFVVDRRIEAPETFQVGHCVVVLQGRFNTLCTAELLIW